MFELFSDIFTYRKNFLLAMDVRAKLIVTLAGLATIILSDRMLLPAAFFVICAGGMLLLRIPLKLIAVRLAAPLGIVLVLIFLKTFFTGSHFLFTIVLLSHQITATSDGFAQGLLLGSRVLGAMSLMVFFSFVTPAYRIFHALRWLRVPEDWIEVAVLVYRFIFVLLERAADLAAAQRLRLGFSGMKRSLKSAGILAGATFLNSLEQALRTHEAMRLRCYTGAMPFGAMPAAAMRDKLATAFSLAAITALYLLSEGWI